MKLPHFLISLPKRILAYALSHKVISVIVIVILAPVVMGLVWLFSPKEPEYILAEARRTDIQQTVEAVGVVISEKDLTLKFPVTGVIADVLVEEGDAVESGQELARLRNSTIAAEVSAARASLSVNQAALREIEEGTRPEDITIAETQLENKRAAFAAANAILEGAEDKLETAQNTLNVLMNEAETSLAGYLATSQSTSSKELVTAQTALKRTEDILLKNNLRKVIDVHASSTFAIIDAEKKAVDRSLTNIERSLGASFTDYREALSTMEVVRGGVSSAANVVGNVYTMVAELPLAGNSFDRAERESQKSTLATESKNAQSALANIDGAIKSLRDAAANFDTRIAAEENAVAAALSTKQSALADILTFETAVRTSEAELEKKKAGARQTEIDAAKARVNQSYADLSRTEARLEDTILRAPFDGVITKVDVKIGEFTGDFDNFNKAISMLGASPYRIEMYVSEIDIPKVNLTQTGAIELDAFPREEILLRVSEIDPVSTEVDGVSKYRVKLDFVSPRDDFRIGMSGDTEIFTDSREDVIALPGRAILRRNGKEYVRVLKSDGSIEEHEIDAGLDGRDGEVEIIQGVEEGQEIIVLIKE